MSPVSISQVTSGGFNGTRINNGLIEFTILPELGGKIASLCDLRSGREWLWRHPRYPYKRVPHGSSYVAEADTGGWDECFPSVSACSYPSQPWQGAAIQDHGELWSQAPEFQIEDQGETVTLQTRWQGVALPYTFSRTITLTAASSRIRSDYEVVNHANQPINFVWCIHALLAIEPGMELVLPPSARFNVAGTFPENLLSSMQNLQYPFEVPGLKFPSLPETSAGRAIKVWSDPLPSGNGWAAIHAGDGEFRMTWDTTLLPQIAAWMNFGAWSADGGTPYYNLGLEPCIGAQDSLEDAVTKYNVFAILTPNDPKTWWLEIELTS